MKTVTLLSLLIALFSALPAFSQMPGWLHNQPITIKENSGVQLTPYQLKLLINTEALITAGEMLSTGDDIRFTSSCTGGISFPYWIESGINTNSTTIWVNIDTLQANAYRTIYMQYGNASATSVSQIAGTFFGPHSATDSVSGGAAGGVTDSQRGIRFAANEDLLVTAFGKNEPNGTTRYITLFDNASQAILRQMQVSGPAAQYSYQNLANPVWLTQGTQYVLECHQGGSDGYYFGPSNTQIGQHLTYLDMRYCNGCDQNTFPTNYLNAIHYGYPDLWYFSKNNVTPAPTYELASFTLTPLAPAAICLGDTAHITLEINGGEAPYTFNWTGMGLSDDTIQNPYTVPEDTTSLSVAVTDNCMASNNTSLTINVNMLPGVEILTDNSIICNGETAVLSVSGIDDYEWSTSETNDTISVMPSVTTSYSVIATDSNGCMSADTLEQLVNVPLTAVRDIEICHGETYFFNNHAYSTDGIYIDTLAGVTSCDSIVTTNLFVLDLPVGSQNVSVCYGTSYSIGQHTYSEEGIYIDTIPGMVFCDSIVTTTLTIKDEIDAGVQWVNTFTLVADTGADSYYWVDCNNGNAPIPGADGSVFEVTENGSYAAAVTIDGCTVLSDCFEMDFIGLSDYDLIENIQLYPNPNGGTFTVQTTQAQTLQIFDATGKSVATVTIEAGAAKEISLADVEPGVYFLQSRTKTIRFVIE